MQNRIKGIFVIYRLFAKKNSKRRNPIFKAQGDKNKLMEKEAPGSFSEGRGDHIL